MAASLSVVVDVVVVGGGGGGVGGCQALNDELKASLQVRGTPEN